MKQLILWPLTLCLALVFSSSPVLSQEDGGEDTGPTPGGVTVGGMIFNMAPDRRTELIGGKIEPEGLDKYMKRRFDASDQKLDTMASQIEKLLREMEQLKSSGSEKDKSGGGLLIS